MSSTVNPLIPNSFQVPNYYADVVMELLNEAELKILMYAIRQTFGFRKDTERISLSEFCGGKYLNGKQVSHGTGVSRGAAINALKMLLRTRILLLTAKGTAKNSNEYGINLDATTIDLQPFYDRRAGSSERISQRLVKANAARAAKNSNQLQDAVRPTNCISGSSNEPQAVHPTNRKEFVPRTVSGSSHEPPILLHGNSVETQLETQGGKAPFDSVTPALTDEARAFEATSEEIQTELRKIFRGLPPLSGVIANLTMYVLELKAPPAYVKAWPEWFRQRYRGQIASHFKFTDTFHILADEGLAPDAWLNGSVGARFVAGCTGDLGTMPVTASVANRVTAVGHWLDTQVPSKEKAEWYRLGYTPDNFLRFWGEQFKANGKPTPDSVMKYWQDFTEWKAGAAAATSKTYCGHCENGWILPTTANESARRCGCQKA